ncbi:thioredoxin peroxidase dot5 [Vermiconidia calcicola]|uniref:Thioredoxin peroxidase dot5 n=1 Tax=Vermiconidia calcicola TaxID=1690605 RepID=A0ACC3MT37_9PEZI|nr:thioredoxin peroxidase dot5 [Vermiconidia calcicola]
MVELRKRPAPPAAPQPAKKKTTTQPKAKKTSPPAKMEGSSAANGDALKVGSTITLEGFGGDVQTHDEKEVNLAKLVADSKAGVVLFTYPKASTPGCTTQAGLFRDAYEPLTATGLSIYGLSNDSPKANTTFKTKQELPYPLLCDPKATLIEAIGMKKEGNKTTRGIFVVDKSGKVLAAEPGGPAATVDAVKAVVAKMGGDSDAKGIAKAENKLIADVAGEVADTAEAMDRSKTGTPVAGA